MAKFKAWRLELPHTKFVLDSPTPLRYNPKRIHYRADGTFRKLNLWLREKGINPRDGKPGHSLRKESGSAVNQLHGLYAASQHLGHTSSRTTAGHYLEKPKRATVGKAHLFTEAPKVVDFPEKKIAS